MSDFAGGIEQQNQKLSRELREKEFELSLLYDITSRISYSLDYEDVLRILIDSLHTFIDYDICVSLINPVGEKTARMIVQLVRPLTQGAVDEMKRRALSSFNALTAGAGEAREVSLEIRGEVRPDDAGAPALPKSSFDVPFFMRQRPVGVLSVASFKDIAYSDDEIKLLYTIAAQASATVERLQALLAIEKNKMEIMVEGMSEGVVMFDEEDRPVIINAAARDMLGYYERDLRPDALSGVLKGLGAADLIDGMRREQKLRADREVMLDKPAARILRMSVSSIRGQDSSDQGMVLVLRDVTAEREVDRLKDNFISMVSHELRTPLVAIQRSTDVLFGGSGGAVSAVQKSCLDVIMRNIQRLSRLITDLLDVSRIEAGRMQLNRQPLDLCGVVNEVCALLRETAKEKALALEVSCEAGLPQVQADADRIAQVVTNLLGNAVKFTPDGGALSVRLRQVPDAVQVDVVDTGSGIARQDLEKIFDKFYQVRRLDGQHKKGTGLGLAISKGIIESHGGRIWAESQVGKGSTFSFTLPLAGSAG